MASLENIEFSKNSEMVEIDKDLKKLKNNININPNTMEKNFWGMSLKKDWKYEVPWISESAKALKHKQFPGVIFGNCRLSKNLGSVLYSDSLVIPKDWKPRNEIHKETFYSQKKLPWWKLEIPWRHVANDGTVRDKDWYICVATNYIPKWSKIMTTLWPGKVYDTWWMKWKWIDIYVNW